MSTTLSKYFSFLPKNQFHFFIIPTILFIYLACLDLQTVDYGHHISIAKWYRENWFSLTNYKHGYIDIGNYPPLAHQLLALFSLVVPIKIAYYTIIFVFWVLVALFSSLFLLEYLDMKKREKYLPVLFFFSFLSLAIIKSFFQWGQYTTIIGFAFGFMSLYYILRAVKTNEKKFFILFLLSLSLLFFSHHLSALIFLFFFIPFIILEFRFFSKRVKSLVLFSLLSLSLIVIGNYPSIERLFSSEPVPKIEIPHESRMPITQFDIENWILSYYGVSLPLIFIFPILLFLLKLKNRIRLFKLYLISIFFFLIGLGRWTPLTQLFLGLEHWLTYERFSMLSGIIFSLFFGFFPVYLFEEEKRKKMKHFFGIFLIVVALSYLYLNIDWFFSLYKTVYGADAKYVDDLKKAEREVISFLNSNVTKGYRYQIFGYKNPIANIYSEVDLPTLETIYFTGRKIDWLRNSNFSEINRIGNKEFLHNFLTNKSIEYSIRYIVTFYDKYFYKGFYPKLLEGYNWTPLVKNVVSENVYYTIWESPYELSKVEFTEERVGLFQYLRGTVPLITLLIFLVLGLKFGLRVFK